MGKLEKEAAKLPDFLREKLLAGLKDELLATLATLDQQAKPVYLVTGPETTWGVGGRAEVPWVCDVLAHLELTLSQVKLAVKAMAPSLDDLTRRVRCAERRQQMQLPSFSEEQRECQQADWSTIFSWGFLLWLWSQIWMEFYWNPLLRFVCCPCWTVLRIACCTFTGRWHKKKEAVFQEAATRLLTTAFRSKFPEETVEGLSEKLADFAKDQEDSTAPELAFAYLAYLQSLEEEQGA